MEIKGISIGVVPRTFAIKVAGISIGGTFNAFDASFLTSISFGMQYPKLIVKVIDKDGNPIENSEVNVNGAVLATNADGIVYHDYQFGVNTSVEITASGKIISAFSILENRVLYLVIPLFDQIKTYNSATYGTLVSLQPAKIDSRLIE